MHSISSTSSILILPSLPSHALGNICAIGRQKAWRLQLHHFSCKDHLGESLLQHHCSRNGSGLSLARSGLAWPCWPSTLFGHLASNTDPPLWQQQVIWQMVPGVRFKHNFIGRHMLHLCCNKEWNANKLIRQGGLPTTTKLIQGYETSVGEGHSRIW